MHKDMVDHLLDIVKNSITIQPEPHIENAISLIMAYFRDLKRTNKGHAKGLVGMEIYEARM